MESLWLQLMLLALLGDPKYRAVAYKHKGQDQKASGQQTLRAGEYVAARSSHRTFPMTCCNDYLHVKLIGPPEAMLMFMFCATVESYDGVHGLYHY